MDIGEQYRVERLEKNIETYQRKRTIALITMYSAIAHCDTLTQKQKEKAKSIIYTMQTTKTSKKYNVKKQLANRLKKQLEKHSYISSYTVEDTIDKQVEKYRVKLEQTEKHNIANKIANNPAQTALDAASEYIYACNQIERCKEEIANPPKKEQPKKQEPKKETPTTTYREPTYTTPTYGTETTTATGTTSKTPRTVEQPREIIPQPYTYSDSESVKYQKTLEYLTEKYKKDSTKSQYHTTVYFEEEDRKMLERLFGGNRYESLVPIRQIEDLIENGYSVEAILNKFNVYKRTHLIPFKEPRVPTLEDLLDMALIIYNDLPKELTTLRSASSEKSIFIERLTNQVGVMQYLEKYEQAYNIYMKYYNKLSDEEKNKIKERFNSKPHAKYDKLNIKDFDILRPEELKNLVNYKVSDLMKEKYLTYGDSDTLDVHSRLRKATKFMSNEQIVTTYHMLVRERDKYTSYSTMSEEEIKYRREWFERLQRNFAHLLLQRLTEEEKKDKTTHQQLYYVCKEYLKEEPRFPLDLKKTVEQEQQAIEELFGSKKALSKATGATVSDEADAVFDYGIEHTESIETATNTAVAAGYNAMNRFFGMKKVEQTIQRITGKWAQFERAWQRAQQAKSQEEITELTDELNGMFRR